jgi:hypothetical protein
MEYKNTDETELAAAGLWRRRRSAYLGVSPGSMLRGSTRAMSSLAFLLLLLPPLWFPCFWKLSGGVGEQGTRKAAEVGWRKGKSAYTKQKAKGKTGGEGKGRVYPRTSRGLVSPRGRTDGTAPVTCLTPHAASGQRKCSPGVRDECPRQGGPTREGAASLVMESEFSQERLRVTRGIAVTKSSAADPLGPSFASDQS